MSKKRSNVKHLMIGGAALLVLTACGDSTAEGTNVNESRGYTEAELNEIRTQAVAEAVRNTTAVEAETTARDGAPLHGEYSAESNEITDATSDLCWQDYCPCEPPQGGPDMGLCRQLRAGIPVDDQLMSAGAMMRDARKQLDEFEQEHGGF